MKIFYKIILALGLATALGGCAPYNNYYPPVNVTPPASSSMHYGSPAPASSSMGYGPSPYPSVTVTNNSSANSMHYGN